MQEAVRVNEHRFFDTEGAKTLWHNRLDMGWPTHNRPFSTLIAAMGNHWHKGCKEAVMDMAEFTWKQGYDVSVYEEPDRCYQPYDSLGIMRNLAYMKAIREGWEYLCYVDNDIKPQEDTLVTLLHRFLPVVLPIVVYADGGDHGLSVPKLEQGRGLAMVTSSVLSMVLCQTVVFLPWATSPLWQDALGADETYHFARLAMVGHRPFIDTNVVVECVSPPHYPLQETMNRTVEDLDNFRSR